MMQVCDTALISCCVSPLIDTACNTDCEHITDAGGG